MSVWSSTRVCHQETDNNKWYFKCDDEQWQCMSLACVCVCVHVCLCVCLCESNVAVEHTLGHAWHVHVQWTLDFPNCL